MTTPGETKPFIDRLVDELQATPAPPRPALGATLWLVTSVLTGTALITLVHWRPDLDAIVLAPNHLGLSLLLVASAFATATLVFRSGIPGRDRLPASRRLIFTIAFALVLFFALIARREPAGALAAGLDPHGAHCGLTAAFLSLIPATLLLLVMKRRYAPVRPRLTGRLLGAAAGLVGALLVSYHCPSDEGMHQLVWHLSPVLVTAWVFSHVASRVLRF